MTAPAQTRGDAEASAARGPRVRTPRAAWAARGLRAALPALAAAALVAPLTGAPAQAGTAAAGLEAQDAPLAAVHPDCGQGSHDAVVTEDSGTWTAANGGEEVYAGTDMLEAMQVAVDSLSEGRTVQESVVVHGSGTIGADQGVELPSHTSFEVCGVIHVDGGAEFDYEDHMGAVNVRHAQDVSVPFLSVTGSPNFGVYLRTSSDVDFGHIDLRLQGGLGMRLDSRDDDSVREARNLSIDEVYVSGTEAHGVETYGVDGLTVGRVTAVETGYSGLLLNDTVNADIGTVEGRDAAAGTGYAAFRTANRNGMIDGAHPTNIRVGEVIASGGGRGIFCVSESGGLEIDRVEISGTGSDAMLLENCHNITIAAESGTVEGPGGIVIAARDEFDNSSGITLQNLALRETGIREAVCGEGTVLRNLTLEDVELDTCAEIEEPAQEAWDPGRAYHEGDSVLHGDQVFTALWWTRGEEPGESEWGAWSQQGTPLQCGDDQHPQWAPSTQFEGGESVVHEGRLYTAEWWTRAQVPGEDAHGPWVEAETC